MVFGEAGTEQGVLHVRRQEKCLSPVISPSRLSTGDMRTPSSAQLSNRKTRDVKYFQSCLQRVTRLSVRGVKSLTQGQDWRGKNDMKPPSDLLESPPALSTMTTASLLAGVAAMLEGMGRTEGSRDAQRTLEVPKGP